jgi:hypothetical protein
MWFMDTTHIVQIASLRRRGKNGLLTKINAYSLTYAGELIGESDVPLCDAARILLNRGIAKPTDKISTSRDGITPQLTASVKWAAEHTVQETETHGPVFVKWRPFDPSLIR